MYPTVLVFVSLAIASVAVSTQTQQPFGTSADEEASNEYDLEWPIRKIAVIGAGASGLIAHRELSQAGFELRLFERESVPGGNWHYTEETAPNAPVPNTDVPVADFVPSFAPPGVNLPYTEEFEYNNDLRKDHRGPKPIWESLKSNTPARVQQITELPWPDGTPWAVSHYQLRNYLRAFASFHGVNSNDNNSVTSYNTRVELVEKRLNDNGQEQGWRLWLKKLVPTEQGMLKATWWTEDFDAVVVATGRYHAPSMPSIPGLDVWARQFPGQLLHSREYRRPEPFENKTILLVGAAASGCEIAIDLNTWAHKVYQSVRPDNKTTAHYDLSKFLHRLPRNTTLIPEIKQFLPPDEGASMQSGRIELVNGTILTGIDHVVFATGFRYAFPFLPQYYDDSSYVPHEGSSKNTIPFLPVNGTHVRDLHLDLFYIRDPTLAFLAMNYGNQIFTYSDYLSVALAKVWSNTAKLPSSQGMWKMYEKKVADRGGHGKHFLFLGIDRFLESTRFFIGWLNDAAVKYGGKQIDGIPKYASEVNTYWEISRYGSLLTISGSTVNKFLEGLGFDPDAMMAQETRETAYYDW